MLSSEALYQVSISRRVIRDVVVLEVAGQLSDVVDDLDRAIQLALADGPRGVVCDLSAVPDGDEPGAVRVLASAGRHVRDWSGIPVAVASPDPLVRATVAAHPLGAHLIVTASLFSAVSMVLVTPTLPIERLQLAPHPTAARAARIFVTHALQDWGLAPLVLSANLVVSELVTESTMDATSNIDVSVARNLRTLRLTVRDNIPPLSPQQYSRHHPYGLGRSAVTDLSRAFGTLPTADGGKLAWAVLNATLSREGAA